MPSEIPRLAIASLSPAELRRVRLLLALFMVGLVLSGATAFPLVWELGLLDGWIGSGSAIGKSLPALGDWISRVHAGLVETQARHPFILYGTDWLAFAHLVIATAFLGPYRDPVRNKWVLQFGLIACLAVFPLAFICGPIRGIPLFWLLIDCSFGVLGALPLLWALRIVERSEARGR